MTSCWGPELSTAIYRWKLGSGITHWDLELAVVHVIEGKEKEEEKYARKQLWSKSNNPHVGNKWDKQPLNFKLVQFFFRRQLYV